VDKLWQSEHGRVIQYTREVYMNTVRMNITIPIEISRHLKGIQNVSAFIAQALREKLERESREKKRQSLMDAYRLSAQEEKKLLEGWDETSEDGL
jgi:hypothetical protein